MNTMQSGQTRRSQCVLRVEAVAALMTGGFLDGVDDFGHARHADKDAFINLVQLEAGIHRRVLIRLDSMLDGRLGKVLELRARHLEADMLRVGGVGADEGQVVVVLMHASEQFSAQTSLGKAGIPSMPLCAVPSEAYDEQRAWWPEESWTRTAANRYPRFSAFDDGVLIVVNPE